VSHILSSQRTSSLREVVPFLIKPRLHAIALQITSSIFILPIPQTLTPVVGPSSAMSNRKNHDLLAHHFINNRVGKLANDYAAPFGVEFGPPQGALSNQAKTAVNFALKVIGNADSMGKVPRKSRLVVLRCAGVEDDSRFRHEPAFWPLTLPASRGGDGLCPP